LHAVALPKHIHGSRQRGISLLHVNRLLDIGLLTLAGVPDARRSQAVEQMSSSDSAVRIQGIIILSLCKREADVALESVFSAFTSNRSVEENIIALRAMARLSRAAKNATGMAAKVIQVVALRSLEGSLVENSTEFEKACITIKKMLEDPEPGHRRIPVVIEQPLNVWSNNLNSSDLVANGTCAEQSRKMLKKLAREIGYHHKLF
jgi:hypothetical protein